jgi:uncharacterized protein (DUF1684 family)
MSVRTLVILCICILPSCRVNGDRAFRAEQAKWHEARIERLKSKTGWLNLAGLYWLSEGENTIGSDSSNSIVFPAKAPAHLGTYILEKDRIRFIPQPGVRILHGDAPAGAMDVSTDRTGNPTLLESGSLAWFIIERQSRYAIRLRDYEHPALRNFQGIETFDPSMDWKISADFKAFEKPRKFFIPNVLGTAEEQECPGILRFRVGDVEQMLYPTDAGERFFIVFADQTSGHETYGGGRFLYADPPGKEGKVVLDFNRAYNPPCAFTPYATCPLPPPENILDVRIEAGEKFRGH